jgi:hypothetical protein
MIAIDLSLVLSLSHRFLKHFIAYASGATLILLFSHLTKFISIYIYKNYIYKKRGLLPRSSNPLSQTNKHFLLIFYRA